MDPVSRSDIIRFRFSRHQLDRAPGSAAGVGDVALLDQGVQDTGPDGSRWALALRGLDRLDDDDVALAWTLRGAPHAYRRRDLPAVAVATAPLSEADAAKRVFDAAKPLRAVGIPVLDALRTVAGHLRQLAATPVSKGEASSRLTALLDEPYLRSCRPCGATHIYEQPFRLSALQAGLELRPGTSPPVLQRVPGLDPRLFDTPGSAAEPRLDVIRGYLRFFGPARQRDVAVFLDSPVAEVAAHWPADAVPVPVAGEDGGRGRQRWLLAEDLDDLTGIAAGGARRTAQEPVVRLVGPFDPYLQLRDRELLVDDEARRKALWPVLGRPGAVLVDGEVHGTWRPRSAGGTLRIEVDHWARPSAPILAGIEEQAHRLAEHRGAAPGGVTSP